MEKASLQALQTQIKDSTPLYESEYFVWREHTRVKKLHNIKKRKEHHWDRNTCRGRERELPTSRRTRNTKYLLSRGGKKEITKMRMKQCHFSTLKMKFAYPQMSNLIFQTSKFYHWFWFKYWPRNTVYCFSPGGPFHPNPACINVYNRKKFNSFRIYSHAKYSEN